MRHGLLVLALLWANTISAATQFKYVVESTGDPLIPRHTGTIRIEGGSYRVDYEGADKLGATASFSTDGGKTVTALNETLSTYYHPKAFPSEAKITSSGHYSAPFIEKNTKPVVSVKNVILEEESSDERIAGHATKKYVLRFTHDLRVKMGGEKVRVIFGSTVLLWTTEEIDLPDVPMNLREIRTGFDTVDQAVNAALSGVKGFPLKRRLAVTRQYEGGRVMVDVVTTTFDDFKTVDLPPAALAVPAGYRFQEPVIGFPGVESMQ
jgi:hypothetical protein